MKRRTFGSMLAAAMAALCMPAFAKQAPSTPRTLPELEAWIAERFDCREGDKIAYTTHEGRLVAYKVFGFAGRGASIAHIVGILHSTFLSILKDTPAKPILYWRRHPEINTYQREELGREAIARESVEGDLYRVPDGWVLDWENDEYRPLIERYSVTKGTMRLAVPAHPEFPVRDASDWPTEMSVAEMRARAHSERMHNTLGALADGEPLVHA